MTPTTVLVVVLAVCSAVLVVGVWWPTDSLEEHIQQALDLTRPAPRGPEDDDQAMAEIAERAHRMAGDM